MTSIIRRVENITKSTEDKREYRGVELSNGLLVLLVSDDTAEKSAAAMNVLAGSLMDSWNMPGTAHFCEHMLFMGTAKYPKENEYMEYISANAGSTNAFTETDHTCYHFDVKPEAFEGALDRFIQFFLTPQFNASAIEREVNAVHSEHSKNLKSDYWRIRQVKRYLSKPGHDLGKFGTGDKYTLGEGAVKKGLDPREELLNFHKKWYSSNIMSCVLVGSESLDELERYLIKLGFDKIPNRKAEKKYWEEHCYGKEELGRKVMIVPVKDDCSLHVSFNIPDYGHEYKAMPKKYFTHLLGHEGKGSLLSELKKQNLASTLSSKSVVQARGISTMILKIGLTKEGLTRTDDVIALIFQYIALLKSMDIRKDWLPVYEELRAMSEINFKYRNKESTKELAESLVEILHKASFEDILTRYLVISEFKPDLIQSVLDCLTPENFFYVLIDRSFAGKQEMMKEPIYGTEMLVEKISAEQMARFREAYNTRNESFYLPEPNDQIPSNFQLKIGQPKSNWPMIILDNPWIRVWFKKDNEFNVPKAITRFDLYSPAFRNSPRSTALMDLLDRLFQDSLDEITYNAYLAGLQWSTPSMDSGLSIKVYGYNDKQLEYLKFLLKYLVTFEPNQIQFERKLKDLQQGYSNDAFNSAITLSDDCLENILKDVGWTSAQKLSESLTFTLEDVLKMREEVFSAFHINIFAHGNFNEEEVITFSHEIIEILTINRRCRPLFANEFWTNREFELPSGELVYHHWKNVNKVSCVATWYQIGIISVETQALSMLVTEMMKEPAFNQLRTNETLGYVASTTMKLVLAAVSIRILVQGTNDPHFVRKRIHAFLEVFKNHLENLTDAEFEKQKSAAIYKLLVKPRTLDIRNYIFWNQINTKAYHFNKREDMAEYLKNVTKSETLHFFNKFIHNTSANRKSLTILVHSATEVKPEENVSTDFDGIDQDYKELDCPFTLRTTMSLYPCPAPKLTFSTLGISPFGVQQMDNKAHI